MPREFKRQGWKTPIELRVHARGLIAFGVLAVLLLLLGRAEDSLVERARTVVADAASDVMDAGSAVADWVSGGIGVVTEAVDVYDENSRLRAENAALLDWRAKAIEYERRIAAFESILQITYTPVDDVTTASVIAETGGPFSRAIVVNAGSRQGVKQGDAALDRFGLVGRVVGVGRSSARVLLLTDTSSHIPVVVEPGRVRAILSGDADGMPRLEFLPTGVALQEGGAILTSGDGGVLPPGLPVGVVRLQPDGKASVALYADVARVEVVALKRYEFINDVDVPDMPAPEIATRPVPSEEDVATTVPPAVTP